MNGLIKLIWKWLEFDALNLKTLSALLNFNSQSILNQLLNNPLKFAEHLGKIGAKNRHLFSIEMGKALKQLTIKNKYGNKNIDAILQSLWSDSKEILQEHIIDIDQLDNPTPQGQIKMLENILIKENNGQITLTKKQKDDIKAQIGELQGIIKGADFSMLSSSWIQSGEFVYQGIGVIGELTITVLRNNKAYTYYGVPTQVWEAMKSAKGKNGSGAGSVFWRTYLYSYIKSKTGIANRLARQMITKEVRDEMFRLAGKETIQVEGFKMDFDFSGLSATITNDNLKTQINRDEQLFKSPKTKINKPKGAKWK